LRGKGEALQSGTAYAKLYKYSGTLQTLWSFTDTQKLGTTN